MSLSQLAPYRPLETKRLLLSEPGFQHVDGILASFGSDPEVTRFLRWHPNRSREEGAAAMESRLSSLRDGTAYSWILVAREKAEIVGSLTLWPGDDGIEVGFALARRFWGLGLAVEAADAAITWAKECLDPCRIWAACDVENLRSARVLEKLGFEKARLAPSYSIHPNLSAEPRDCLIYEARVEDGE